MAQGSRPLASQVGAWEHEAASRLDIRPKPALFVATIAKGFIPRLATATQIDSILSREIDHVSVVVFHDDLPRHTVWTMRLTADVRLTHATVLLLRCKDVVTRVLLPGVDLVVVFSSIKRHVYITYSNI